MKNAYTVLGLLFIAIALGAAYAFNRDFIEPRDTENIKSNKRADMGSLTLTSSAFQDNGTIPSKYTCDGNSALNPPLSISGVPDGTASFVLIMDDPDVPKVKIPAGVLNHWLLFNIRPDTTEIPEGAKPESTGTPGLNGHGEGSYFGPCPPPEYEPSEHRYIFTLYALDSELPLDKSATKEDVLSEMNGRILQKAELIGRYKRL